VTDCRNESDGRVRERLTETGADVIARITLPLQG
jgi:hypothetical protein